MPTLSGWQDDGANWEETTVWARSLDVSSYEVPAVGGYKATAAAFGALTSAIPVEVVSGYPAAGVMADGFGADWYHRVHVIPAEIDIGNLLSVQTRSAEVWNAHFTSQALSAITETATDGITESGIVAPTVFGPLLSRQFDLQVDTAGPAVIDASYVFIFPAESPALAVSGRRVVVFGHAPNWAEPVRERMNWLTDVLTTQSGIEQRIGLRGAPRRGIEYELVTLSRSETSRLENMLLGWQARLFAVPVWTDVQALAAPLAAGSLSIPCTTVDYEFAADGLALLWRANDEHEAVEVASVGASSLTLKLATLADWPAGTRLYPIRLGRLPARQGFTRLTGHHLAGRVAFAFVDNPGFAAADSGDTYAGYRVYLGRTNWADPIETEAQRQLDVLDYETGAPWVDDLSGLAALLKSWHWLLKSRAEIVALRGWLAARAGKLVPFWSISQAVDIAVLLPIGSSDTQITVENAGYARYVDGRADRRHLVVETLAGVRYYRAITGATEVDAASENIGLDSALGVTLQPAEIASVRFLDLVRLDSDEVEIEWHTSEVAECSTMLRSLPQ